MWGGNGRHGARFSPEFEGAYICGMALTDSEPAPDVEDDEFVEDELLVEEISIDGMCGVY